MLCNKWLALSSLLFLFFFYEWLDLWASPALTAWLIVAYFVASFVMEAAFAPAFVPLGLGIWIVHYAFHFLIGATSIVPVWQEFLGLSANWALATSPLDLSLISLVQVVALVGSFLWSMMIARLWRNTLTALRNRFISTLLDSTTQ